MKALERLRAESSRRDTDFRAACDSAVGATSGRAGAQMQRVRARPRGGLTRRHTLRAPLFAACPPQAPSRT